MADINIENLNKDRIKLVDEIKQKQENCVSLSNVAELVEKLRNGSPVIAANKEISWIEPSFYEQKAADTIEQLMRSNAKLTAMYIEKDETACKLFEENAKLKAERDAAVADLRNYGYCKNCNYCTTK